MRTIAGASRMQMRFTLQARTPDTTRWSAVAAPGFGSWVSSAPGTSRYVYTKRVESLLAPASYRVLLRFRWTAPPGGAMLPRTRAYSPPCKQPDPRPNLVVSSLGRAAGRARPAASRYVAFVRNTGRTAAAASSLRVALDGHGAAARGGLGAGAGRGRGRDRRGARLHRGRRPSTRTPTRARRSRSATRRTTASRGCARRCVLSSQASTADQ